MPTRGLRLDLEAMAEAAKGSKLVFVCDPNNPTGDTLAPGEWGRFLDAVPDGCLVAVDEAYADYLAPHERPERIRDVASGRPVVVLRTFSKLFGIAGLRLGYAIVHPALVPCLDAVQEPFNLNRPALAAGMACLSDAAAVEARRKEVVAAHDGSALALDRAGFACARSGRELRARRYRRGRSGPVRSDGASRLSDPSGIRIRPCPAAFVSRSARPS